MTSPSARPDSFVKGRSVRFGFAMGTRFFLLLAAGFVWVPLVFIHDGFKWILLVWNLCLLALFLIELRALPHASRLSAGRTLDHVLKQLEKNRVFLHVVNGSGRRLHVTVHDTVPQEIVTSHTEIALSVSPNAEGAGSYEVDPQRRGEHQFGSLFMRYEAGARLAQRWAVFELQQAVRVLPNLSGDHQRSAFLIRSRHIELQQRTARLRGQGREFESLRDFQPGDELRNVCWTATARRSKLVTTQRQIERSQTIWTVIDCGRLMRARIGDRSKLDYAVEAAITLAQVADYGGDASAMLAYGQNIQQRMLPGRGSSHLQTMLQLAAMAKEEVHEADHLLAAGSLASLQKSRAMIVWITDLADLAVTPEVVTSALTSARRHLVVMAVIGQPDVTRLVSRAPNDAKQAFLYAAASELTARRELALAQLRSRGVKAVEISASQLTSTVVNQYLEVKLKNLV